MKKIAIVMAIVTGLGTVSAQTDTNRITVNGEGIVKVTPDIVNINVRAEFKGESADEVKTKVDRVLRQAIQFLVREKIDEKEYKTDYLNLTQQTDYNTKETHYVARQSLSVRLKDIEQYSKIVKGLMDAGMNRIDGISFEDSKLEAHRSEARKKAARQAVVKARDYAEALGVKLGEAQVIRELTSAGSPRPMLLKAASADSSGFNEQNDSPLAVGQIEIKESVEVSFEIE